MLRRLNHTCMRLSNKTCKICGLAEKLLNLALSAYEPYPTQGFREITESQTVIHSSLLAWDTNVAGGSS